MHNLGFKIIRVGGEGGGGGWGEHVMMTSFTEVRLFSIMTYGMRNPLHAGYTFTQY